MVFFSFSNFFIIFLEFPISRRVGRKLNDTFYILSFQAFSIRFWLEMKPLWYFLIFWIFLQFCWSFQLRVGQERNVMIIFFSLFLILFQPILAWNEAIMVLFSFSNFLAIFLEFSITRRAGTKRNDNFYFLSFSSFSNLFPLEMKP